MTEGASSFGKCHTKKFALFVPYCVLLAQLLWLEDFHPWKANLRHTCYSAKSKTVEEIKYHLNWVMRQLKIGSPKFRHVSLKGQHLFARGKVLLFPHSFNPSPLEAEVVGSGCV